MLRKQAWQLTKATFGGWSEDKAPRLCAALSYYTVFSIAPFLIICLAIASMVLGDTASSRIISEIEGVVGTNAAEAITSMIKARETQDSSVMATVVGGVTLILGALGLFGGLQDALNTVWEVAPKPGLGIWGTIRKRFTSFTVLLGTCFLLLVSLVASTAVAALSAYVAHLLPIPAWAMQAINLGVSFVTITALFALIFKFLPDAKIAWRDVWVGAAITAFLFTIGKWGIGLYLGRSSVSSSYGAAGSVVVMLLWVYYSTQILLLGAEFTKVWAESFGSHVKPSEHAVKLTEAKRVEEGIPHRETVEKLSRPHGPAVPTT